MPFTKPNPASSLWMLLPLSICLFLGTPLWLKTCKSPSPARKAVGAGTFYPHWKDASFLVDVWPPLKVFKMEFMVFHLNTIPTPGCSTFKLYSFFPSVTVHILDPSSPSPFIIHSVHSSLSCRSLLWFLLAVTCGSNPYCCHCRF